MGEPLTACPVCGRFVDGSHKCNWASRRRNQQAKPDATLENTTPAKLAQDMKEKPHG